MSSFTKFLKSFDKDSNAKGKQFEHFVKWFLKNDPEWSTQVDKIWLWNNYPKRWGPDCGIDLVFQHKNGDVWAVQAKCYSPENKISKPDIDKFLNESDRRGINRRLLIATTDKINSNAKQVCDSKEERPVTRFLFSDFDKSAIEYPSHISKLKTTKRKKQPSPRKHQLKAISAAANEFKKNDRGQLIMACGTGKTFTTLWIKEKISANSTLVLLPSLSLLSQTLREWTFAATKPFDTLCVCSDQSVGKKPDEDELIHSVKEVPFPVTSDTKEISTFLKGKGRKVIFSTYQSSPLIEESQRKRGVPVFDLVIADEAHRCAGKIGTEFTTVLDAKKIKVKKRLFTTATPRTYSVSLKKSASEKGVEITDMSDEEVFGKSFYELKFGEAIERGLLTDYQVIIVGVDDPMIREWIEIRKLVTTNAGDITDAESLASQIGLIKAIKKYDLQRMISFHSRVKRAKEFSSNLQDAIDIVPQKHRPKGSIWTDFVSGEMTAYDRRLKLGQLKELSSGDRGLLSNAKCLSEGVDVPALDGVAFIDPKNSPTDIVQAVGRAIRLSKDKKVGTIILPVFIKDGENAEASIEASNFKPVWNVLNALKAHDNVFSYELDQLRTDLGKKKKAGGSRKGFSKINFDLPESIDTKFSDSLKTYLIEKTTASWNFWFGLLEVFVEREGHSIVGRQEKPNGIYSLGNWVHMQRVNYKNNQLTQDQIIGLQSLPKWSWDVFEDQWMEGFEYLTRFVDKEGHSQPNGEFKTEDKFRLGFWVSAQRVNKKNNKLSQERIEKLESLPKWSWDVLEDQWMEGFEYLTRFVDKEGHSRPNQQVKIDNKFLIGIWVRTQRVNKCNLTPSQIRMLESLPKWCWNVPDDNWKNSFSHLEHFVQQKGHARVPQRFKTKDSFNLGHWVVNQRGNKNKLTSEKVKKLEALPKWSWDVLEDQWEKGFSHLSRYVERKGHSRVPARFVTKDGFKLGQWIGVQKKGRENLSNHRINKLEKLSKWSWDIYEDAWQEGFSYLEKFVEEKGHSKVPTKFKTKDGYNLGAWVSNRRSKKHRMSLEQISKLEELPQWTWDSIESAWKTAFSYLLEFVEEHGHSRVPPRYKHKNGYPLGTWIMTQRGKKETMKPYQLQSLEELPKWSWDPLKDNWEEAFSYLLEFIEENGHSRVPAKFETKDGFKLGSWLSDQKKYKKKNKLPDDRIQRLEELPQWIWMGHYYDESWEKGFSHLKDFVEERGHSYVKVRYVTKDGYKLGLWSSYQRGNLKKNKLTQNQIERLESLKGWVWESKSRTQKFS